MKDNYMNWYEHLYVGERISQDAGQIREQIEAGNYSRRVWLILLSSNGTDLFDIRPAPDLGKEYFREQEMYVIGLAKNRDEAVSLIPQIAADYLSDGAVSRYIGEIRRSFRD